MTLLMFDYGHGGKESGATFKGRYEKNDVLKIGQDVRRKLLKYKGVSIDETRTTDATVSLGDRCLKANRKDYDFFISFHRNAFNKSANGVEVFTYTSRKPPAVRLAGEINSAIVKVGFTNRGVKSANFKVLRSTKADAVLLEIGFIDSIKDNELYDRKYNEIVDAIVNAIVKVCKIETTVDADMFYRVITGSFNNRPNADERVEQLKMKGFDSFIDIFRG